jgi:transcription antitermination factor NusG
MADYLDKVNRDLRRAKRNVDRVAKTIGDGGVPVPIDQSSIDALKQALVADIEKIFTSKFEEMKGERKVSIDPASMSELQSAVPVPQEAAPVTYRVDSIVTDREGNILSADIRPVTN